MKKLWWKGKDKKILSQSKQGISISTNWSRKRRQKPHTTTSAWGL